MSHHSVKPIGMTSLSSLLMNNVQKASVGAQMVFINEGDTYTETNGSVYTYTTAIDTISRQVCSCIIISAPADCPSIALTSPRPGLYAIGCHTRVSCKRYAWTRFKSSSAATCGSKQLPTKSQPYNDMPLH